MRRSTICRAMAAGRRARRALVGPVLADCRTVCSTPCSVSRPVFTPEPIDLSKGPVIRYQHRFRTKSLRGDQKVEWKGLALPLHGRTGGSVTFRDFAIPGQHISASRERAHRSRQAFATGRRASPDSKSAFAIDEVQAAAIGMASRRRTTAGCSLMRWLTVLVSSMCRVILSTRQAGHGPGRPVVAPRRPESLPEAWPP